MKFVYASSMHLASNSSGTMEYFHVDHLGSTRLKTDASGNAIYESNYEPYGPEYGESGSEEFRYTGKQEDATGFYYFGARYYDPVTGRFITRDSLFGDLSDPQSLNRYSYCSNNPMKYIDPDGRCGVFWIGLLYMTFSGYLEARHYIDSNKNWSWNGVANNFLIGFNAGFFDAVGLVVGIVGPVSSIITGVSSGGAKHIMKKAGSMAGAEGVEDPGDYTVTNTLTDAGTSYFGDVTANIVSPNEPVLQLFEGELVEESTINTVEVLPEIINHFKPIEYYSYRSLNPSDLNYKDPWIYGR